MRPSVVRTVVIACAFVFGVTVAAQEKPGAKPQDKPGGQKEHTMTGCLQKGPSAETFIVQNTAEKGPKTIGIIESKANLAPHVGHKIDITGTAVPNKEVESGKSKLKADHYMRITAVKMVSSTCP
jgi:hypothetical protein